jgi:hypothetical protein
MNEPLSLWDPTTTQSVVVKRCTWADLITYFKRRQ